MSARAQTVRLSPAQHHTLAAFAKQRGLSEYAMLARVVDAGLAALVHATGSGIDTREIVAELASVSIRIFEVERVLDRALFTACAAYCYARSAALGIRKTDEIINERAGRVQTAIAQAVMPTPAADKAAGAGLG